jgi:hypothetical protein
VVERDVVIRSDDGLLATKPSGGPALVCKDCDAEGREHQRDLSIVKNLD